MDELPKNEAARGVRLLDAMILLAGTAAVFAAASRGPEWVGMLQIWAVHSAIGAVLSVPRTVWRGLISERQGCEPLGNLV
jgi:hypothetical protein